MHYRWPVRFARDPREKPLSGQMFDLSSKGMAMLFHANEDCPRPDQSITANFGVPHFDAHGSFDTAFFNRVGRVCRVDRLTSRVNRVAIQFAEPLFFNPGEQDIAESDAQQRLQAKARSVGRAEGKGASSAEALARPREVAEAKAEVQSLVRLREEADNKARAEAEKRVVAEAQARESARLYEQEIAKFKAEAAREMARLKDEASYKVAEAKAEVRAKLLAQAKAREKEDRQKKKKGRESGKGSLVKKVDEFITDRNQIY